MNREELIKRAKKKVKILAAQWADPRYLKTLGKLKSAGLIEAPNIIPYRGMVFLEDALWAAQLEPRIYELLPAIIIKKKKLFAFMNLPDDLKNVIQEIIAGSPKTPFRGVSPKEYGRWVPLIGRQGAYPSQLKSFRFRKKDLEAMQFLQDRLRVSQVEVLRMGLDQMKKSVLNKSSVS